MTRNIINDRELLRLIDGEKMSQAAAARVLGVTRQAVSKRLIELRGRTTRVIVAKQMDDVMDRKIDAMAQLKSINDRANELLNQAKVKPDIALKCMNEIRGQLKLQLEIFNTLYDLRAAQEFQNEVLAAIGEVAPDVRRKIIHKLNQKRAIRSAIKFN